MRQQLSIALLAIICTLVPFQSFSQSLVPDAPYAEERYKGRRILPYDHLRESDVFYAKKIWRVIDTREKMNLPFAYPSPPLKPFVQILVEMGLEGEVTYYDPIDDQFTTALTKEDIEITCFPIDTIDLWELDGSITRTPVPNPINYENVKKYRIKEMWVFDEETSTMVVRILGIAPILDKYDDNGNYQGELPLFWAYYPELRNYLVNERVFNIGNDAHQLAYTDLLEMRYFSSYIYKESNVHDRRLQDYATGIDGLLEGERIKNNLFEFEHNLWSY